MTLKEVNNLSWELFKIINASKNVRGVDASMEIANTAIDAVHNIERMYPKIKTAIRGWEFENET